VDRTPTIFAIFQTPALWGIAIADEPVGVYEAARQASRRSSDSPYREISAIERMDNLQFPNLCLV